MKVRLYDLLGQTMYACDWHESDMRRAFGQLLQGGEDVVVDLAKMSFTNKAYDVIQEFSNRIEFRNSDVPELDTILIHNRKVRLLDKSLGISSIPVMQVKFKDMQDVVKYIKGLPREAHVRVTGGSVQRIEFAICHLLAAERADVSIYFGSSIKAYFEEVRRLWCPVAEKSRNAYWEIQGDVVVRREVKDQTVQVSEQESVKESEYRARYLVIPCAFGEEAAIGVDTEFKPLFEQAIRTLKDSLKAEVCLLDFLEEDVDEY